MPDGRMLSKTIADNEELGAVSLEADYLFARCVPHLDREGRMTGNPDLVKARVCPLRPEITSGSVPDLLRQLAGAGLVRWYQVDGKQVLEFPGFKNHQRGFKFDREAASRYPASDCEGAIDLLRTYSGPAPDLCGNESAQVEVEVEVEVEETKAKALDGEPSTDEDPEPDDAALFATVAPLVREHLWLSSRPPNRSFAGRPYDMGRELKAARLLAKRYGYAKVVGAIPHARKAVPTVPPHEPISLLYFVKTDQQQRFYLAVAEWEQETMQQAGEDPRVKDIMSRLNLAEANADAA